MRKIARQLYRCLMMAGTTGLVLAARSASADPMIVSLTATEGAFGSFVTMLGTDFGEAQGQSYVLLGVARCRLFSGPTSPSRSC
jgi:hypothetical protein